jgi:putative tryptophan/tyrosine transport system substrate-binding protein
MRRRAVLAALAAIPARPWASAAQTGRCTVAVLMPYDPGDADVRARVAAFQDEMKRLGWHDESLHMEERWATDRLDQIRAAAAELVALKPDVLFFTGGRVVPIVQRMTRTIPSVFVGVSDPLGQGLVPSLARPGGNLTGIALPPYTITAKLVQLLKQISPDRTAVALVLNPANPSTPHNRAEFEFAAGALSLRSRFVPIRAAEDIEPAFSALAREAGWGLVLPSDLSLLGLRETVTAMAAHYRLPAIYSDRVIVTAGGLVSYSADRVALFRQGASYVDRILRGAQPGELAVQQPARYELVLNLRTARTLGLDIPSEILLSADEVIE